VGACWPSLTSVCPPSRPPPRAGLGTGLPLRTVRPNRFSRRSPTPQFSRSPLGPYAPPRPPGGASAPAPPPAPPPRPAACLRPLGASAARRARDPFPPGLRRPARIPPTSGGKRMFWGRRHRGALVWLLPTAEGVPSCPCSHGLIKCIPIFPVATGSLALGGYRRNSLRPQLLSGQSRAGPITHPSLPNPGPGEGSGAASDNGSTHTLVLH
jgi:hypothetical protein